jgi:hypothetical protein
LRKSWPIWRANALTLESHGFEGRVHVRIAERDSDDPPVGELVYVHGPLVDRKGAVLALPTPVGHSENAVTGVDVLVDL